MRITGFAICIFHLQMIFTSGFFKGVLLLGTRFGPLELKIWSLESDKIINALKTPPITRNLVGNFSGHYRVVRVPNIFLKKTVRGTIGVR